MDQVSEQLRTQLKKLEDIGVVFSFTRDAEETEGPSYFVGSTYQNEQAGFGQGFDYNQAAMGAYFSTLDFLKEKGRIFEF